LTGHISRDGRLVWCERTDHLERADGTVIASIPIMAIMELDADNRIERLREYPGTSQRHPDALKHVQRA
jgi:limonene-1,2-epoxide hydrolase